ncbi:hypothetical protein [Catenulispora rubra]|uniref:hypothetical protein n=1 Tax=Catenulispora rubra TaxID=280293 RepID=UPI0018926B5A|nr:hypothetical protein [Catenulispora rubra]
MTPDADKQHRVLLGLAAALRAAAKGIGAAVTPPAGASAGQLIAHHIAALNAICDDLVVDPALFEHSAAFTNPAVYSYNATTTALNNGRTRQAICLRLLQYSVVLQPDGLTAVYDQYTAAAVAAMRLAGKLLAAHAFTGDQLRDHLIEISEDVTVVAGYCLQAASESGLPDHEDTDADANADLGGDPR